MSDLTQKLDSIFNSHSVGEIQAAGFHLQRKDFYSPLNDLDFLDRNRDLWRSSRTINDINWNLGGQTALATEVTQFVEELRSVPQSSSSPTEYCWNNPFWNNADAVVQYGLVRSRKPKRYIEIGCGYSTLLLKKALEMNKSQTAVTLVEPYPRAEVLAALPLEWRKEYVPVQRCPLSIFDELEPGDFLFYDGSHCSKSASDVNWMFFEVFPRLKPGVIIHIHDIFFPNDYPESWFFERGQTWNEQYLLQAFLMNNAAYSILICNSYIAHYCGSWLQQLYKGVQPHHGCSFWMEKVAK